MSEVFRNVLITGAKGMLAHAMIDALRLRGISAMLIDRDECDLTNSSAVRSFIQSQPPTIVINCAAYTNVDKCEVEIDACNAINGVAVGTLAKQCRRIGATLVHFSTDFVFDGSSHRPYRIDDPPNPLSAYGRSKLLGERELLKHAPPRWLIIRTAWLYGPGGASFPRTMVDLARAGKPLRVVNDQIGAPTYTRDLAAATLDLIDSGVNGVMHVTNAGQTSWFDFAQAIFERFDLRPALSPITSADWKSQRPASAARPAYSVLDLKPAEQAMGGPMRDWRQGLADYRGETA